MTSIHVSSPALTRADIGVAIGAGTDIAIDSADIVLLKSGLVSLPAALKLSRAAYKNMKQNLFWAFFYNAAAIPLAAGALSPLGVTLSPMIAAAAMSMSSVCVVTNALRLARFGSPDGVENTENIKKPGNIRVKNKSVCRANAAPVISQRHTPPPLLRR